ncbi:MAG: dihydrofolate reductase family protein [Saprospiraceae bacterium]
MQKVTLYIAISLNGKIAKPDGSVAWLENIPNPDLLDYGYADFYQSIGTTIQGRSSYDQVISWDIDFPYAGKTNFVFTRKQGLANTEHVTFISEDHVAFVKNLKSEKGDGIWLIGGGQLNTMFLNERLVDELRVFVMPIVLSEGIELFESLPNETALMLKSSNSYPTGVVELRYGLA